MTKTTKKKKELMIFKEYPLAARMNGTLFCKECEMFRMTNLIISIQWKGVKGI